MSTLNRLLNPGRGVDATDIPGLVAHLSADSLGADPLIITDNVGGRVITDVGVGSAGWTIGSLGGLVKHAQGFYSMSQAWPAPGQNSFGLFAICTFPQVGRRISFGGIGTDAADSGISLSGSNGEYIARSDTIFLKSDTLSPAPAYSFTGAMLLVADLPNNEARKFASNGGSSLKIGASSVGDINVEWPELAAKFSTSATEIIHAGLIVFSGGLPSDAELASAVKYMGAYRRLPPHWRGM